MEISTISLYRSLSLSITTLYDRELCKLFTEIEIYGVYLYKDGKQYHSYLLQHVLYTLSRLLELTLAIFISLSHDIGRKLHVPEAVDAWMDTNSILKTNLLHFSLM